MCPSQRTRGAVRVSRWARMVNSGWHVPRSPRALQSLEPTHPEEGRLWGQNSGRADIPNAV